MVSAPQGTAHWINAIDIYNSTVQEVVIVGSNDDVATMELMRVARSGYNPNRVIAGVGGQDADEPNKTENSGAIDSPLLEDRPQIDGKPTAFVCENYACQLPVTDPEALAAQLA